MSRSTSSLSTLTTVPVTMSPSSNSTIVPEMASAKEMPPRSSLTTCIGWYSPSASVPPNAGAPPAAGASSAVPGGSGVSPEGTASAGGAAGVGAAGVGADGVGAEGAGAAGASSASVAAGAPWVVLSGPATSGAGVVL